jgi:methylated-DNA-protein-cysteine methyltransferase-like protein
VYEIVARIPVGRGVSYGDIAKWLLHPRGARAVGWAMSRCPGALPWHRVVLSSGDIAGGGFAPERRERLRSEDVPFLPDGRVDMDKCRWIAPPGVDKRF